MNRPRLIRGLRIAFSAACLIACVLLIALWVRSYWWVDATNFSPDAIVSVKGNICVDEMILMLRDPSNPSLTPISHFWGYSFATGGSIEGEAGLTIPYWILVLAIAALGLIAGAPWINWHFSLRTLLIATTLVAVVLGLLVWAAR